MDPVNWDDPCARAAALREVYFELLAGRSVTLHRYRQLEEERESRYQPADLSAVRAELRQAEIECSGGRRIHTVKLSTSKGL